VSNMFVVERAMYTWELRQRDVLITKLHAWCSGIYFGLGVY